MTSKPKLMPLWYTPYVRTLQPEPSRRSATREWVLLAIALGALCLGGCTGLREQPMGQWHCDGWRTLADGTNECMDVRMRP